MPHLHTASLSLPFSGNAAMSRHTSLSGATAAIARAGSQKARILVLLLERGPSSDGEVAQWLGLPEGRISARRGPMVTDGLIAACDIVPGPYGADVTRWTLTVKGLGVAGRLREAQG